MSGRDRAKQQRRIERIHGEDHQHPDTIRNRLPSDMKHTKDANEIAEDCRRWHEERRREARSVLTDPKQKWDFRERILRGER